MLVDWRDKVVDLSLSLERTSAWISCGEKELIYMLLLVMGGIDWIGTTYIVLTKLAEHNTSKKNQKARERDFWEFTNVWIWFGSGYFYRLILKDETVICL